MNTTRRKRRDGVATRERLVEAAITILGREGLDALSTVNIAKEAGTAQSGLYMHFDSLEALSVLAAERVGRRVREPLRAEMARFRAGQTDDPAFYAAHYENLLSTLAREWRFLELLMRYRREPSPLGRVLAEAMAQVERDVALHLLELGRPAGLRDDHLPRLSLYAHLLTLLMIGAAEASADDPPADAKRRAADLARHVGVLVRDVYETVLE